MPLSSWLPGILLAGALLGGQMDLDCSRPQQARTWVGRLMLGEIEGAEDIHREGMWRAFGRCPAGALGTRCRDTVRERFEAEWELQKRGIEDKYRKMLLEFEDRCRAAIAFLRTPRADGGAGR